VCRSGAAAIPLPLQNSPPGDRDRGRRPATRPAGSHPRRAPRCAPHPAAVVAEREAALEVLEGFQPGLGLRPGALLQLGRRGAGRGEYLNEKLSTNPTSRTSARVASKSASLSPGKPTIRSVVMARSGRAARRRSAMRPIASARSGGACARAPRRSRSAPAGGRGAGGSRARRGRRRGRRRRTAGGGSCSGGGAAPGTASSAAQETRERHVPACSLRPRRTSWRP
jgi:hypothetical protein